MSYKSVGPMHRRKKTIKGINAEACPGFILAGQKIILGG